MSAVCISLLSVYAFQGDLRTLFSWLRDGDVTPSSNSVDKEKVVREQALPVV